MPCLRARLAEGHEEALKRELEAYQDNELKLQKELTACRAEVDALTGKGARFDAIQSRLNAALEGYNEAKHRADATASALALCQAEKKDLSSSHTELLQKVELLQVDKIYLQKSAADATERMEQLRAEVRTRVWHSPLPAGRQQPVCRVCSWNEPEPSAVTSSRRTTRTRTSSSRRETRPGVPWRTA